MLAKDDALQYCGIAKAKPEAIQKFIEEIYTIF
jgi:hypothetical protein